MQDTYENPLAKLSLAVAVAQQAKSYVVSEFGIGEEIAPNMLGWVGAELAVIGQLDLSWPEEHMTRADRIVKTASVIRQAWGCDAITFFAEAYVSSEPDKSRGRNLAEMFASDTSNTVHECISFFHVEKGMEHAEVCALPFAVQFGKKVKWGALMRSPSPDMLRESELVATVRHMLSLDVPQSGVVRDDMFFSAMAMGCHDRTGFFLQYDFS